MSSIIIYTLIIIIIITKISGLFVYLIRYYDLKEIFFWILAKKQGIRNVVYFKNLDKNSIETINNVLNLKIKGNFIEHLIATPAWKPILSLESVDNQEWEVVKKNFLYFINKIELNNNLLGQYVKYYTQEYINSGQIIDSIIISKITVKSFCKFLFDQEIDQNKLDILYNGSIEWRKEISIKGQANYQIKLASIQIILDIIKLNNKVYNIFGNNWEKPEYYSVILQPFIISPMINISDIMVNAQILLSKNIILPNDYVSTELINKIIYSYHPFPVLERFDPETSTQYFIPLDKLTNFDNYNDIYKSLVFGTGIRKCAGQTYVYIFLKSFLTIYFQNQNKFNPMINHKFSGRNNDNFNLDETIYMSKVLLKIISQKN